LGETERERGQEEEGERRREGGGRGCVLMALYTFRCAIYLPHLVYMKF